MSNAAFAGAEAMALGAGEGRSFWLLGDRYTLKVTAGQTGGAYSVTEVLVAPDNGPPPHVHLREDETYCVLEGMFAFPVEGRTMTGVAGSVVRIPRGTLHTYKNVGPTPGRFLVLLTPGGFEGMFERLGTPAEGTSAPPPFDPAVLHKLLALAPEYHLDVKL